MIPVKPHIAERAYVRSLAEYQDLYRQSVEEPEQFWRQQAGLLDWYHPPRNIVDVDPEEVDFAWFSGGRLNACYNCVDRHLATSGASRPPSSGPATSRACTATSPTASSSTTSAASPTSCSPTA